jgi:hypothetical protein
MAVPIALSLTVPVEPQQVGQPIPVTIRIENISSEAIWIVGALDGSETGLRYPRWQPEIISSQPLPETEPLPLSDMSAPLRAQDFRRLQPGESFDPTEPSGEAAYLPITAFQNFRPPVPGRYKFRLTLSTQSDAEEEWLGIIGYPGQDEVLKRLQEVPRVTIEATSEEVEVR